jgi:hypothetical protein
LLCPAQLHPGRCRSNDRVALREGRSSFRVIVEN